MNKKRNNTLQIFLLFSKILILVEIFANLVLSVNTEKKLGLGIFSVLIVIFWLYGFLGSLGYLKKTVSEDEDGVIVFDTPIPIIQIGILRILQFGYFMWRKRTVFNYRVFIVLIAIDVVYLIALLLDKGSYYYMSISEEDK